MTDVSSMQKINLISFLMETLMYLFQNREISMDFLEELISELISNWQVEVSQMKNMRWQARKGSSGGWLGQQWQEMS